MEETTMRLLSKTAILVKVGASCAFVLAFLTAVSPTFNVSALTEAPYGGTAWAIPGQVEAENYDTGGQGVGYSKPAAGTSSLSPAYRSDEAAQIESTGDTGGGYDVGWTNTNDWYRYTVNVTSTGTYNFNFRVASPNTGSTFHMEVDGNNVTGTLTVPNTGGWQTYTTQTKSGLFLSAGQHVLRWYIDNGGMNLNWFSVSVPNSGTGTAWQNGSFHVDAANVVAQSNIVLASANTNPIGFMPLGNGNLGVAAWAANGFTAQLNRNDTHPNLKSPGWVVISGLTGLGGGTLDLYNAKFTRSGGGMTATSYVLQNKDELIVDVTGANTGTTYTAQVQLWSGRSPTTTTSGPFAIMYQNWVDNGSPNGPAGNGQ